MCKAKYIIILSFFISFLACDNLDILSGQSETFKKVLGSGNSEIGKDILEYDGGYIILATITNKDGLKDIALYKTDRFGNQKGDVDTLSSKRGGNNFASKLLLTNDGGFVVLGTVEDTLNNDTQNSNSDIYLSKFSSPDVMEWEQFIGGNISNEEGAAIKKAHSGYIIAGSVDSIGTKKDVYIVKVDGAGIVEWTKNWGGSEIDYANDIIIVDNGYFVIGTTNSFHESGQANNVILFLKLNLVGGVPDNYTYGSSKNDFGTTAVLDEDGGYIIVGSVEENAGGNSNIYLRKVDENIREKIWNRDVGLNEFNDLAFDIVKSSGGYIIVGTKELSSGPAGYILEISGSTGETIFENTYGGFGQIIQSIIPTSGGGYIMTGSSGPEGNEMIYLVKVNAEGEF